jgi:threonyl-tRNA synthetase
MNNNRLDNLRHSAAHLLAQAVLELFPGTKLTIGPTTETGFFYDFLPPHNFKEEDLVKIEEKMHELAKKNYKIEGKQVSKDEAKKIFKGNEFKQELIDGIADKTVGVYCQGDFCDLCKGGHVDSTDQIKYFKLTSISGSYWRANREGVALQRIYGIAFETKEELEKYLKQIEDAKQSDHRVLGKQLDLFSFNDLAPASVFYHPKGTVIINKLIEHSRFLKKSDFKEIRTPVLMKETLWKISGHADFYKENMFFFSIDKEDYCLKPMNCPGHVLLYKEKPRSYKELPIRFAEYGYVHRRELSGVLHGLFRVRAFTQDDSHVFCTSDQLQQEILRLIDLCQKTYAKFDFEEVRMVVATRPEKFIGTEELWQKATDALEAALKSRKINYTIEQGGGAFYGPKIDMKIKDALGREWQCGTVQVDFNLPKNFELKYIESDQTVHTPIMLHCAICGSLERFFGIIIEHYKGKFPFWISPIQVRILTITDAEKEYAQKIYQEFFENNIRVELDESGDQISAQIKKAQLDKIPWMIVIGKKEKEKGVVTLRHLDGNQEFDLQLSDVIKRAQELNKF